MKRQAGFTLIELVIVIVILGILAAVAVPRFVDLSEEAEQAAIEATAGAIASAAAINFAAYKASGGQKGVAITGAAATVCSETVLGQILQAGAFDNYNIEAGTAPSGAPTDPGVVYCKLTSTSSPTVIKDGIPVKLTN